MHAFLYTALCPQIRVVWKCQNPYSDNSQNRFEKSQVWKVRRFAVYYVYMRTRVLLLIGTSLGYTRGILRGIMSYSRPAKPWVLSQRDPGFPASVKTALKLAPQGIIAFIS